MKRFPAILAFLILSAALATTGCTRNREDVQTAGAAQIPAKAKATFDTLVIPDGTIVAAALDTRLSTETNHAGDAFVATTMEAILVGGRIAAPAGAKFHGVLRDVEPSGRVKGRARMTLVYESLVDAQGKSHAISAQPLTLQAASATHSDVEKIAAGSVLGALIGGVTGGGKGAAIGAGAGAGAGTVLMLATKGDEVELEAGQRLNVQMTSSTSIQVLAQN